MRCSQIKLPLAQRSVLKVNCTHVEYVAEVFRCCSAVLATLVATAERRRQIENRSCMQPLGAPTAAIRRGAAVGVLDVTSCSR